MVVVAVAPSFDDSRDVNCAHQFFASVRRQGSFFELGDSDVTAYFETHITALYNAELAQYVAKLQSQA